MTAHDCPTSNTPDVITDVWDLGYSLAVMMGCSFPGEPVGVCFRLLLDEAEAIPREAAQRAIIETVGQCDACYGQCTVQRATRRGLGDRPPA